MRQSVVATPVGPPPSVEASRAPEGALVVFSALDFGSTGDSDYSRYHSGYRICSLDGKQVKYVNNRARADIEDPEVVSLAPGRYKVVARAAAFGTVEVSVVIEAGKMTFLHLDGSELTSGRQTSASDFVSLSDGLIIGWRAQDDRREK
jgi:hypothetical protein